MAAAGAAKGLASTLAVFDGVKLDAPALSALDFRLFPAALPAGVVAVPAAAAGGAASAAGA